MTMKNINGLQVNVTNHGKFTTYGFVGITNNQAENLRNKLYDEHGKVDGFVNQSIVSDRVTGYFKTYNA